MAKEKRLDLIDREVLRSTKIDLDIDPECVTDEDIVTMARALIKCVREAPTVDAVEVVHAHWDNNGICTLCGYPIPTDSKYDFIDKDDCLFCYHCGAIMNGGNADGICKED